MNKSNIKSQKRDRRHGRIRAKVSGTSERPRLSVFKSNTMIYAQLIDDRGARTLASSKGKDAREVGKAIGEKSPVRLVVFDRGGYAYTGKIKLLADGAREAGLKF